MVRTAAKETVLNENEVWDVPEEFMLKLVFVPEYALRVRVWNFLNSFESALGRFHVAEAEVRSAGDALENSVRIQKLLALILHVGNYLNGGTPRGRADGFDLDTLTKLGKLKDTQKSSLL